MPELRYLDNQVPNSGEINQVGTSLNHLALAVPQLRMQALRLQQQAALNNATRILREIQAKEGLAKMQLLGAQTQGVQQKTKSAQDMATGAKEGGQAGMLARNVAGGVDSQEGLGQAVGMLRSQGLVPQGQFEMPRDQMTTALNSILAGNAQRAAMSSPAGAASLMRPTNIPQGGTGYNGIGDVVMGQPKPIDVGPNHMVYPAVGQPPMAGMINAPEASTIYNASQDSMAPTPIAVGSQRPLAAQHLGALFHQLRDDVGVDFSTPQGIALGNEILAHQGMTNQLPPYRAPAPPAPPSQSVWSRALDRVLPPTQPQAMPQSAPMSATNPKTGQRIQSLDGGKTWIPAQ